MTPTETPHDRTVKHAPRPQRFEEGYDESMEETIKPSRPGGNRRTKTTFDEMRRAAENRPIMPTPPRANTMPMSGSFEPPKESAPPAFQNMHNMVHPNMSVQTQFSNTNFHTASSSQPPSATSENSHHASPATLHMGEYSSAFDLKPDLHHPGMDGSSAGSPGTDTMSRRGSPHRRTESIASLASAASIASKAAPATGAATPSKAAVPAASSASDTPVETKMYKIEKVYGEGALETPVETKMYKVQNVYDS